MSDAVKAFVESANNLPEVLKGVLLCAVACVSDDTKPESEKESRE